MADDFSELMALATDLENAPAAASPFIRKAVQVTAHKVKKDAQNTVSTRKQIGHAAAAIHYETQESGSGVDAEIGYDKGGVGNLGNIVEFGSPRFSPSHDLGNALLNNEADFEDGIAKAVSDGMREVGL